MSNALFRTCVLIGAFLISGLLPATALGGELPKLSDDKQGTSALPPLSPPPSLGIKCLFVQDRELWNVLGPDKNTIQTKKPSKIDGMPAEAGSGANKPKPPFDCPKAPRDETDMAETRTLIGAGDVSVVVTASDYQQATAYHRAYGTPMYLYINGVPMGSDAELVSIEQKNGDVHLLYRVNPGKNSQRLWAMLYRTGSLTDTQPLRVAFGWSDAGPTSDLSPVFLADVGWGIQITSKLSQIFAWFVLVIIGILFLFVLFKTDAFRDGPPADWWREAESLRVRLADADAATRDAILMGKYPTEYTPGNSNTYRAAANSALGRKPVPPEKETDTIIGLSLLERKWSPVPAAFSLARVQLGVWFLFAVATGVFLWIVYGQLPAIDGSLLALLGLSVATTGMSFAVDSNAEGRSYTPTQGFLTDITTGFDDRKQIHRYQAVVVNLLLLVVGSTHVLNQLAYPIFDTTWLAFLGVSGVALAVGKQLVEAPKAKDEQAKAPSSQTGQDAASAKPDAGAVG